MKRGEERKRKEHSDSTMLVSPTRGSLAGMSRARLTIGVTDWRTSANKVEARLAIGGTAL